MDLTTTVGGFKLKNPLMPASGPLSGDYEKMKFLYDSGVGAMVTKTISIEGAKVPRPCIYGEKNYIMNTELWSEYSYEKWLEEFLPEIKNNIDVPLIVSAGYSKEDMKFLIPKLNKYADMFEISTHYVGKNLRKIGETVKMIRTYTMKPLYIKMSPHIPEPVEFVKLVIEEGATGVVIMNSLGPTMNIDLESRSVKVGNDKGQVWMSGPAIKPMALALVNLIKENVPNAEIIGTGGVESAEDVLEFLLAGASGVQMLSAAMMKGKGLYKKVIEDLPKTLEKYNFKSVQNVINSGLTKYDISYTPSYPICDDDKCTLCGVCEKDCPYFAVKVDKDVVFDTKKCFGCGLCQSKCPVKAISGVY